MNKRIRNFFAGCVCMKDVVRLSKAFRRDERGVIAIVFMLVMLPIIGLTGAAIDFSLMSRVKAQAQVAADTAAIASITENYLDYKKEMQSNVQKAYEAATQEFDAHMRLLKIDSIVKLASAESKLISSDQVQVRICFEGEQPTSFLSILGFKSVPFSGCSEAVSAKPYYMNVYILVDASGSMGIGASEEDRTTMHKLYKNWVDAGKPWSDSPIERWGSCEFLCHTVSPGFLPDGTMQPDGQPHLNDPVNRKLFRTRFDVLKQALMLALDGAATNAKFSDQFKFNIFKFSSYLTEVFPLSADISAIKSKINSMEPDRQGAGTNYTYSIQKFSSYIPKSGDGSSSSKAKTIVIILSDGLESSVYEKTNCVKFDNDYWLINSYCKNYGNYYAGFWDPDPNITYRNTPKLSWYAWAMDDQSCKPIQETEAEIMVLATVVYEGGWANTGNDNLRKCASQNKYAFTANSADDVNKAIQQMFGFVMSVPRFSYGGFDKK